MSAPIWIVWCPEDGEDAADGREIRANNSAEAAEIWAADDDSSSAEYRIVSGKDLVVNVVEKEKAGPPLSYRVAGETEPVYWATEIKAQGG
jgi:hypothetical protein